MLAEREKIVPVYIEEEMKDSYIDYSMSVIVARALPDIRDGLKPVHRRVLFGMRELRLSPGSAYKKCARIVGEVLGKYHPHGDTAVYDTLVRMAQDFSLRYPLVDGQGNFGSVDGDSAAAMRYTEARLARIAEEVLRDLEKDTVDFVPNFDESLREPTVMPSLLPNLLVNGSSGIAVGMATNIPPHNLREIVKALVLLISKPAAKIEEILQCIQGPDFPTGAMIYGYEGIVEAYKKGRGRLSVRARASIESVKGGRENIVITEIPYQVNKTTLIEAIANLIRNRKIEGISDIRDESDRDGLRLVLELRREAQSKYILEQLYKYTQMQTTFGVIMLALVDGIPKVLNIKEALQHFIDFRHEVTVRRLKYDLNKAEKRAHILEGLKIALDNIDEIVALIKKSRTPDTARNALMKKFQLSEIQAQAILDMRLQRLTGLERKKIEDEYKQLVKLIFEIKALLQSKPKRMQLIRKELEELGEKYGDDRRTEIIKKTEQFSIEEMIAEEDMAITITHKGFIKRMALSAYKRERSASKGANPAATKEDFVEFMCVAGTHAQLLFFTEAGRCYWLKVLDIPLGGKMSKGRALRNILNLGKDEKVTAIVSVKSYDEKLFLLMVTQKGLVKKIGIAAFSNPRKTGIMALTTRKADKLVDVHLTSDKKDVLLVSEDGKAIRFAVSSLREMGRTASGVRGINLASQDNVVSSVIIKREGPILAITDKGFAKRSSSKEYRQMGRGGKGIVTFKVSEKVGKVVRAHEAHNDDEVMIITNKGNVLRRKASVIKLQGRNTQGVKLLGLAGTDSIADVVVIPKPGSSQ